MPPNECKDSKFKLCFTLKQHTPLIHFQANQNGATLRATELKPKLDRFLIEVFEKEGVDYKDFLIKGQEKALDYKVKIIDKCKYDKYYIFSFLNPNQKKALQNLNIKFIAPSLYFAQEKEYKDLFTPLQQKNKNEKKSYKVNEDILKNISRYALFPRENQCLKIEIVTKNSDLLERIKKKHIYRFFAKENFGTRQNKGFGSFSISNDAQYEENLKSVYPIVYKYQQSFHSLEKIFELIKNDYTHIKSGINFRTYKKSLLFLYFVTQKKPIRWEKRKFKVALNQWIKQNKKPYLASRRIKGRYNSAIYDGKGNQSWFDPKNKTFEYRYIRALLGLADKFEFKSTRQNDYIVKPENSDFQRYKSPITFKIYNNIIYLVANKEEYILNKRFEVKTFLGDESINVRNISPIYTPEYFDIDDFLDFALNSSKEKIANWKCLQRKSS